MTKNCKITPIDTSSININQRLACYGLDMFVLKHRGNSHSCLLTVQERILLQASASLNKVYKYEGSVDMRKYCSAIKSLTGSKSSDDK